MQRVFLEPSEKTNEVCSHVGCTEADNHLYHTLVFIDYIKGHEITKKSWCQYHASHTPRRIRK